MVNLTSAFRREKRERREILARYVSARYDSPRLGTAREKDDPRNFVESFLPPDPLFPSL